MAAATPPNIVLDAGRVYLNPLDANGNTTGEVYMASTPGFTLNVTNKTIDEYHDDGTVAELLVSISTQIDRAFKLQCKDLSPECLEMFYMADRTTVSQGGATFTNEAVNGGNGVKQGRWYQLGESASQPAGARNIEDLVVKVGADIKTLGTDYKAEPTLGRIYIVPGGGIADAATPVVDYDTTAASIEQFATHSRGPVRARLRYVSDPAAGTPRDIYCPSVVIHADGDLPIKSRDKATVAGFNVKVMSPGDGGAAIYLNGRAV